MHEDPEQTAAAEIGVLDFWREGEVWFRDLISRAAPWGDETLLPPVPAEACGHWGLQLAEATSIDGTTYGSGETVVFASREELRRAAAQAGGIAGVLFPWCDRVVPPALLMPHFRTLPLERHREAWGRAWTKAFLITAGIGAAAWFLPEYRFIALVAAMFFGVFPLVEASMAWMRRVDRLSVPELNRQLVNHELFRRWMLSQSTLFLKFAVGALALVFAAQLVVDGGRDWRALPPSIEAAALVKPAVLEHGEWWRIVTTGLMHGGLIHIIFNGMALFNLGRVLSAFASPAVLGVVFLATVVTGSLASLYLGSPAPSVGASGGLLGLLGFLLVICQRFRAELPDYLRASLIQAVIVISIFGLLGARFIDNAAHGGGFLGGVLIGLVAWPALRLGSPEPRPWVRMLGWASLAILLAAVAKIGIALASL